jgi:hypothetical protein
MRQTVEIAKRMTEPDRGLVAAVIAWERPGSNGDLDHPTLLFMVTS